jgi:DNA-binding response OmpR family regulator
LWVRTLNRGALAPAQPRAGQFDAQGKQSWAFERELCMAALGETVFRNTKDDENIIETGDFRINVYSRSVTVRGRQLQLNGAEFDVLVFLTSHKRRLVTSHTKLSTRAEGSTARQEDFLPALLSLRRKLEEEMPGVHYIDTEAWLLFDFHPCIESR